MLLVENKQSNDNGFDGGFTVLMAVYHKDNPLLFKMALDSVFANTLLPNEVILVVDGPVPTSIEQAIESVQFEQRSLTVHRLDKNRGLAVALNAGLDMVTTKWVVRADSDDINRTHRFAYQADAILAAVHQVDIIGAAIQEIDFDGSPLAVRRTVETNEEIRKFARRRNPFNHQTVAFRVDLARQAEGYPIIHLKEDYALWAKMIQNGARCLNLSEILVDAVTGKDMYRRRGGLKYAISEVDLQAHLVSCGLKTLSQAVIDGLARSTVFLMPSWMRGFFYMHALR